MMTHLDKLDAAERAMTPGPWAWGNYVEEIDPLSGARVAELIAYGPWEGPEADQTQSITAVMGMSDNDEWFAIKAEDADGILKIRNHARALIDIARATADLDRDAGLIQNCVGKACKACAIVAAFARLEAE